VWINIYVRSRVVYESNRTYSHLLYDFSTPYFEPPKRNSEEAVSSSILKNFGGYNVIQIFGQMGRFIIMCAKIGQFIAKEWHLAPIWCEAPKSVCWRGGICAVRNRTRTAESDRIVMLLIHILLTQKKPYPSWETKLCSEPDPTVCLFIERDEVRHAVYEMLSPPWNCLINMWFCCQYNQKIKLSIHSVRLMYNFHPFNVEMFIL
jgi:hypothetical protein